MIKEGDIESIERIIFSQDELTDFLLCTDPNGDIKVEAFLCGEDIWLSQKAMAQLFSVQRPVITKHLNNIFKSGELDEEVVCSILELPTQHGAIKWKIQKTRRRLYNLDAALSVSYRVNSVQAMHFRIWVSEMRY